MQVSGRKSCWQVEQPVQRSWGWGEDDYCVQGKAGKPVWLEQKENESGTQLTDNGDGLCRTLWTTVGILAFILNKMGVMGGC